VITVYCWLLCLYPLSYRHEFGAEIRPSSARHEALLPQRWLRRSASTEANFVDSYQVLCVLTLTVCSALPYHFGG